MKNAFSFTQFSRNVASHFGMIALALLVVLLTGCDSNSAMDEPEPEPEPTPVSAPAPAITMSSIDVSLSDGGQGLQFFARADEDVFYKKVTIKPPPPFTETTYNLGNTFVIEEQTIALQNANVAYRKVGGSWSFAYEITVGTGANAQDHTVTVSHGVASKKGSDIGKDSSLMGTVQQ